MKLKLTLISTSLALAVTPLFADPQASIASLQAQINALQTQINQMGQTTANPNMLGLDTANPFGTMSKVEMPLALIKARGTSYPNLVLGGQIQSDLQYWNGNTVPTTNGSTYKNSSGLSLSKVYLFNEANIGQHALAMLSFVNSRPAESLQIDRAFVMLGELTTTNPLFVTVGSAYLPFGSFSGNGPLDNALTTNLFRVSPTNQVILNYGHGPFTLLGGIYNNSTNNANDKVDGLATALFNSKWQGVNVNLGASYLSNIVGTASEAGSAFNSGTATSSTPLHSGTNPAYDVNFGVGITPFTVIGEYVSSMDSVTNLNVNVGKISAWMLGTTGKFNFMTTLYDWQLSYSHSQNLQNVPTALDGDYQANLKTSNGMKSEWLGSIQGEYWQNVYLGPELSYDKLYNNNKTYTATLDLTAYF